MTTMTSAAAIATRLVEDLITRRPFQRASRRRVGSRYDSHRFDPGAHGRDQPHISELDRGGRHGVFRTRHELDAVHCKHCGMELHIRTEGMS